MPERAASGGPEFDPTTVPPFPVLTLHADEDLDAVTLDGAPIEPMEGQTVREAGIDAIVRRLEAQQLEAVRVRITTPAAEEWRMVVTADGQTYDTTPEAEGKPRGLTRRRLLAGGAGVAMLGMLGGAGAIFGPRLLGANEPPPWTVPGAGVQIPVAVPAGFDSRARWAVPVGRSSDVGRLDTGHIVTVSDQGTLTVRHPETAQPQWSASGAPDSLNGVRRVSWAGTDAIAVATASTLHVWPMIAPRDGALPTAVTHSLGTTTRAELHGPSPFLELQDWFLDVPAPNMGTKRITIPAGTRAALREENGTIHTIGPGLVHHLDAIGARTGEHPLSLDRQPAQMPAGVWGTGGDTVIAAWADERQTRLTLIRPHDGAVLMDTTVTERIDQRAKLRRLSDTLVLLGSTVVSTGPTPFVRERDDFKPTAAHGTTLYGTLQRVPATLELKRNATPQPAPGYRPDDPPPSMVTATDALFITEQLDTNTLFVAPRR